METNPFQPTVMIDGRDEDAERGTFGRHAQCLRKGFLHREIQFDAPFRSMLIYDGWWFRQKVTLGNQTVWFRVSWLTIHRHAEFEFPEHIDSQRRTCRIEITFSRTLFIRRFQIWLGGEAIYDEID